MTTGYVKAPVSAVTATDGGDVSDLGSVNEAMGSWPPATGWANPRHRAGQ